MWGLRNIQQFLTNAEIPHTLIELPYFFNLREAQQLAQIPQHSVLASHLLRDQYGLIMVIHPASHLLDSTQLNTALHRQLTPLSAEQQSKIFRGLPAELTPPLGDSFGIKTVISEAVCELKKVYFPAGDNRHLIQLSQQNFMLLQKNATIIPRLSRPDPDFHIDTTPGASQPAPLQPNVIDTVLSIDKLPAMPMIALQILRLNANPYAHADELTNIITQDPSISAQIMRYARSPLYGYSDRIKDLDMAIRMLGHEMVSHLSLGIAMCKPFHIPQQGPLGLTRFWQHALHSALLMQQLARELPHDLRPHHGTAYLCGLLHNFGQLILAHSFPEHYANLIQRHDDHPDRAILDLEQQIYGFTHTQVGSLVLEHWNLPSEIVACAAGHHVERYNGLHSNYVRLQRICDLLLDNAGLGIGPTSDQVHFHELIASLQLDETRLQAITDAVLEKSESLNTLATQIAA